MICHSGPQDTLVNSVHYLRILKTETTTSKQHVFKYKQTKNPNPQQRKPKLSNQFRINKEYWLLYYVR